jgi:hypothetical protein
MDWEMTAMQRIRYVVWGWIASAAAACSSNGSVNIGDDNANVPAWAQGLGGTYSTEDHGHATVDPALLQAGTVPPGCEQRQEPFNPTITYRGYIQGYQGGPWPSDVVILKFAELTTSAVSGRMLSDQAGAGNYATISREPGGCWPQMQGAEGFQYTMLDPSLDGQRLQFTVNLDEPSCAWCGQQTSYAYGNDLYNCIPNGQGQNVGDGWYAVQPVGTTEWQLWDCLVFDACTMAGPHWCVCSADGCGGGTAETANHRVYFDLVMNGDQLTGPATTLGNVILTRETP